MLHEQHLDDLICQAATVQTKPADLKRWDRLVGEVEHPKGDVTIAMCRQVHRPVGLVQVAQRGAAPRRHPQPRARSTSSTSTPRRSPRDRQGSWRSSTPSWCPAASASAAWKARSARPSLPVSNGIPYLGICLGMQVATIEYARHKAGLTDANSTEFEPNTPYPVIALIDEWLDADGTVQKRDASSDLGGTMRLGRAKLRRGTGHHCPRDLRPVVTERHRHRYEPTSATSTSCRSRPGHLRDHPARKADRDGGAAQVPCTPGMWACSSTPSSSRRLGTVTRCSSRTSRPPWITRPPAKKA
jgi:CTP synthase